MIVLVTPAFTRAAFRFMNELGTLNAAIVVDVQQSGIAVPSSTRIDGRTVIRINLTNHRVTDADLALLLDAIVESGRRLSELLPEEHNHA